VEGGGGMGGLNGGCWKERSGLELRGLKDGAVKGQRDEGFKSG